MTEVKPKSHSHIRWIALSKLTRKEAIRESRLGEPRARAEVACKRVGGKRDDDGEIKWTVDLQNRVGRWAVGSEVWD